MSELTASDFKEFFRDLHGYYPFPWQESLTEQVCSGGGWPKVIDLPTASGKTACIDIALFALAVLGARAPRRIFFVVDRRVIVDEALERAERIRVTFDRASADSVAGRVAARLRDLAGQGGCALKTAVLRGGTYRDESWIDSPRQPAVVTSTVDQLGSRLLFRGYGMKGTIWPMHAGMIANDALIFLDEAHCSKAFAATLEGVEKFREWAVAPIKRPFHFVQMTATPKKAEGTFEISDRDRENEVFRERLKVRKPTRLVLAPAKTEDFDKLAGKLVEQAMGFAEKGAKRVAIMVNRVEIAKLVWGRLEQEAILVIGRMRPLDRDELNREGLKGLRSGEARSAELRYVVATQCLEVGADLDFDALVSECASVDALLQRFGRVDRLGRWKQAQGAIVAGEWQLKGDKPDAVYGNTLKATWEWLRENAVDDVVNFGIEANDGEPPTVGQMWRQAEPAKGEELRKGEVDFPALLPGHLDALVQTGPAPAVSPEVEFFLHGKQAGAADVQVVWRGDLDEEGKYWGKILEMCPPCSLEAMPVQFWKVRRWLRDGGRGEPLEDADVEGVGADSTGDTARERRRKPKRAAVVAFVWRDERKRRVEGPDGEERARAGWTRLNWPAQLRPGDTVVLRVEDGGWEEFGHIPSGAQKDIGDAARYRLRKRVYLRLHPQSIERDWLDRPEEQAGQELQELLRQVRREDMELKDLLGALEAVAEAAGGLRKNVRELIGQFVGDYEEKRLRRLVVLAYPDGNGKVLTGWLGEKKEGVDKPTSIEKHVGDVARCAERFATELLPENFSGAIRQAGEMHDWGKVDVRYQAWLRGDSFAARYASTPIAKSGIVRLPKQTGMGLPEGFRHELLSLLFAQKKLPEDAAERDLILHLIASHHGGCRPFAPVVVDEKAACVEWAGEKVSCEERREMAAHRLGSGTAERFWDLTRRHGWWGLAYLEGLLRLADWKVSSDADEEVTE
jgi:CRISPR-associated endonuclease/helicase Cas3